MSAQAETRRWKAEHENASARLELARIKERIAELRSQHEPVHAAGLDREKLSALLGYLVHGDMSRLIRTLDGQP